MANIVKDVKFLGKDFGNFRKNLIEFSRNYFPNTVSDFSESSPGVMILELCSYVGDVLSFYIDEQLKESLIQYAEEEGNVYTLSNAFGYKAKNTIPATTTLDMFQIVPVVGAGTAAAPDYTYCMIVDDGMTVHSEIDDDVKFRTTEVVDFSYSSSLDPTYVTVYQINDSTKIPDYYLLKKRVKASSGEIKTKTYAFGTPKIYDKILLDADDVTEILDVTDSDGNIWYEVPFLAQDTIFKSIRNIQQNDPDLYGYREAAPYLLKLVKTSRRFVKRLRSDHKFELQFGAGISSDVDEEIIPTPDKIGLTLSGIYKNVDTSIDPSNFLYTRSYGLAPSNTTLTIRYVVGKGLSDNVSSNDLINIDSKTTTFVGSGLDSSMETLVGNSLACTNPSAAVGGASRESIEDIRNNTISLFASQNRAVTADDYIVRTYTLPPKYGSIAKAYIVQDDQLDPQNIDQRIPNPLALNLYVLGYDKDKKLTQLNKAVKENLKTYLSQFRMLTDAINIKDAFIINIGIDFEVITLPGYNANEVIFRCIDRLRKLMSIEKWQINQPIIKSQLYTELDKVEGVQSVVNIKITNLWETDYSYSGNVYDIAAATENGICYPSKDPSCWEIRNMNQDIRGRTVNY